MLSASNNRCNKQRRFFLTLPADSICCLKSRLEPRIGKYLVSGLCLSGVCLFLLRRPKVPPTSTLNSLVSDSGRGDSKHSDSARN